MNFAGNFFRIWRGLFFPARGMYHCYHCSSRTFYRKIPRFGSVNMAEAALALQQYNDRLEQMAYGKKKIRKLYPGKGCSLTACGDHELELSPMFGNCLVKRLPQGQLFGCLRRHKRYLQTAGLICREDRRPYEDSGIRRRGAHYQGRNHVITICGRGT